MLFCILQSIIKSHEERHAGDQLQDYKLKVFAVRSEERIESVRLARAGRACSHRTVVCGHHFSSIWMEGGGLQSYRLLILTLSFVQMISSIWV